MLKRESKKPQRIFSNYLKGGNLDSKDVREYWEDTKQNGLDAMDAAFTSAYYECFGILPNQNAQSRF